MSILSKIEELSNRCNDIARLLAVNLTQNSFIQPICYDIPNTSNFCVFDIDCFYDTNSQFYDSNIIADNILKYYTTVCKTHKFEDIYVNIDFKNFLKTYNDARKFVRLLNNISNGIKLYVGEKEIHVVDYMKSSSMSKSNSIIYIIFILFINIIHTTIFTHTT